MRGKYLALKYKWYCLLYGPASARTGIVLGQLVGYGLIQGIKKGEKKK